MNELDALGAELRQKLPAIPDALLSSQSARLASDPKARVAQAPSRRRALSVAFAVAAFGILLWVVWPETAVVDYQVGDGSSVHLDRGARGSLSDLGRDGVRFDLERGRAVFDVARRQGRVFRVIAGRHVVTVLGTRFSVSHDPSGTFSVEVERGAVSVQEADSPSIQLVAGDRLEQVGERIQVRRATATQSESLPKAAAAVEAASPAAPTPASASPNATERAPDWRQLFRKRDYAAALAAARQLGLDRLTAELGAAELADLADVARLGGDPAAALAILRAIERRFPGTEQGRQAQFLLGRVFAQLGRVPEAEAAFERYLGANPDGAYSAETMGRLLDIYVQRGDTVRARRMAERYLERTPTGPYQRLARSQTSPR